MSLAYHTNHKEHGGDREFFRYGDDSGSVHISHLDPDWNLGDLNEDVRLAVKHDEIEQAHCK
jgi:hypothetical protein